MMSDLVKKTCLPPNHFDEDLRLTNTKSIPLRLVTRLDVGVLLHKYSAGVTTSHAAERQFMAEW